MHGEMLRRSEIPLPVVGPSAWLGRELCTQLRRQMRDAFYCDADDWKSRVVAQGREVALEALAAPERRP